MIGFSVASLFLPGADRLPMQPTSVGDVLVVLATLVMFAVTLTVGAMLAILRPHNAIGWLLLVGATCLVLGEAFTAQYVNRSIVLGADLPGWQVIDWLGGRILSMGFMLLLLWVPLLFPVGRLPGPRWRPFAWLAAIAGVTGLVADSVTDRGGEYGPHLPNPLAVGSPVAEIAARWGDIANAITLFAIALATVSLIARFRRSVGLERQQLKWFLAAAGAVAASAVTMTVTQADAAYYVAIVSLALLPIAVGIAVFRYRLYEIDRIISRTLGWALVTGVLAAVFAGAVIALQALLAGFTEGETLAVAASTLVAFALFQPLRRRVQTAVDRRFDRTRYDGERTVDAFAEQLRDKVELETVSDALYATAVGSVKPSRAGLWLRRSAP